MINLLLKPQLNLVAYILFGFLCFAYGKDMINNHTMLFLSLAAGVFSGLLEHHFYKENK